MKRFICKVRGHDPQPVCEINGQWVHDYSRNGIDDGRKGCRRCRRVLPNE